jgi:hypothetical protein
MFLKRNEWRVKIISPFYSIFCQFTEENVKGGRQGVL